MVHAPIRRDLLEVVRQQLAAHVDSAREREGEKEREIAADIDSSTRERRK